jgi:hypothetical protein
VVSPELDTVGQAQTADEPSGVNEDTGGSPQAGPVILEPASTVTAQTAAEHEAGPADPTARAVGRSLGRRHRKAARVAAHTVRAAITGLRHAGREVNRSKDAHGQSVYRVTPVETANR